jgi:hypothetical protein
MRKGLKIFLLTIIIFISSSFGFQRVDFRNGMFKNVCKDLKNNVLVYFIFVDTKETSPWTEFDIKSTIDSMEIAVEWIESQAQKDGIPLNIITDYFIGNSYTTIRKNLPFGTVEKSISSPNYRKGIGEINLWADNIAKKVGSDVQIMEKDGIPETPNPKNIERLVAHLRDLKSVESVAMLYMVNNYYRNDISVCLNQLSSDNIEYSIVSYKYPATIAQNILSLFGAADFARTIYRRDEKKIELLKEFFPKDIMQDVYAKDINSLEIGEMTAYLIGWSAHLDPKYHPLLTDRLVNF